MKRDFFPGAATPHGFHTFLPSFLPQGANSWRYDLKGSSGSGKSTLLKKIAANAKEHGLDTYLLHCSSDPNSLDGVVIPSLSVSVVDATAPHISEPVLPGVTGRYVDLTVALDETALAAHKTALLEAVRKKQMLYQKSFSFLKAAAALIPPSSVTQEEIEDEAETLFRAISSCLVPSLGENRQYFLWAATPDGIVSYPDPHVARRILLSGAAAPAVLEAVARRAVAAHIPYDMGFSPLCPHNLPEQLFFPSCALALSVQTEQFPVEGERYPLKTPPQKYGAEVHGLIERAVTAMRKAREWHRRIEGFYIQAIDYTYVEHISEKIIGEILAGI